MGTFVARSREIRKRVGEGLLIGHLDVDQIYAYCQHEHLWWRTRHKYLTKALRDEDYFGPIAKVIIASGGKGAMIKSVEKLNKNMAKNAPKDTGALAGSGGPTVFDNGAVVYSRPPAVARKPGTNKGIAPHKPGAGAQRRFRGYNPLPQGLKTTKSTELTRKAERDVRRAGGPR